MFQLDLVKGGNHSINFPQPSWVVDSLFFQHFCSNRNSRVDRVGNNENVGFRAMTKQKKTKNTVEVGNYS